MAKRPKQSGSGSKPSGGNELLNSVSCGTEKLLLAALERGSNCLETGRYLISYREGMLEDGIKALKAQNFRVADARDFADQAVNLEDAGDAEAMVFPELGVALVGGDALQLHGMSMHDPIAADSPIEIIEPEYFAFSESAEYLRGFLRAASIIAHDLGAELDMGEAEEELEPDELKATWGLTQCKVLQSRWSGTGIKVAVLDTGMD
ncbi:MAG: peptidase S8, partial [Gammaproteobacteria bacterium]|nr:peptidase S8 [Gammaproteobacteria bacterium]